MQAIFKTVAEKANDCNAIWEKTEALSPLVFAGPTIYPKFNVVSEIIISIEVIEKSFDLFGKEILVHKDDFYYLFWKQLRTDLREWIRNRAPEISNTLNNVYYSKQIADIETKLSHHFEALL